MDCNYFSLPSLPIRAFPIGRTPAEQAALVAYPQLQCLLDLRACGGWMFRPLLVNGGMELLTGARLWPGGWSDAIAIRDIGDAKAFRCDGFGGEVWKREGGLVEVIHGLLELPAPHEPGAPRLVRGSGQRLWRP